MTWAPARFDRHTSSKLPGNSSQQHFASNDTAAVVYTSGRRDRAQEFTSDRALLLTSIDKFMGTKLRSSTLDKLDGYYMQRALAEGLAAQNNGEPVDPSSSQARDANPFSRGEGYPNRSYDMNDMERGQRALGVLGQIKNYAEFLANVRGRRKAMVLFSEGIDYPINDIFAAHDATTVLGAMRDAVAAAARANVNIFTVDPRGLVGLTSEYIELNQSNADLFNIGARDPRYGMQPQTALLAEMRLTQDSLRTLSEETGGLASIDTNSFSISVQPNRPGELPVLHARLLPAESSATTGRSTRLTCASNVPACASSHERATHRRGRVN